MNSIIDHARDKEEYFKTPSLKTIALQIMSIDENDEFDEVAYEAYCDTYYMWD